MSISACESLLARFAGVGTCEVADIQLGTPELEPEPREGKGIIAEDELIAREAKPPTTLRGRNNAESQP